MRKLIALLAVLAGLLAAVGGVLLGLGLFIWESRSGTRALPGETVGITLGLLGLAFGLLLAGGGWRSYRGVSDKGVRLPGWGWLLLITLAVLGVGQAAFLTRLAWLIPFLHVIASVLPPLVFLSLAIGAARSSGKVVTVPAAIRSLAWGGLGAIGMAMFVEMLVFLLAGLFVATWLEMTHPGSLQQLQAWAMQQLQSGATPGNMAPLIQLATSPVVVLIMLILVGVAAPLIEETSKTLAVPLVALTGRKLTRLEGFLLGVAAGAGFAAVESSFYGIMGLNEPRAWSTLLLTRGATAAIHCFASGLAGLGWQAILSERRWTRGLAMGLLGTAIHGAWNLAAAAQAWVSLIGPANGSATFSMMASFTILGSMGLVWLVAVTGLSTLPRRLARRQDIPTAHAITHDSAEEMPPPVDVGPAPASLSKDV